MKIKSIDDSAIIFDNGNEITFDHEQDCCECNYAKFKDIDDIAKSYVFLDNLDFEEVANSGFRFGNFGMNNMVFVPCYSLQNGYYSSDVDIYYNGEHVLNTSCEMEDDW